MLAFAIITHTNQVEHLKHLKIRNACWFIAALILLLIYAPITQAQDCPSLTITASPSLTIASNKSASGNVAAITGTPCKLVAEGATSYKWSTGASTSAISTTVAGTYSVTGITAGCSATASVQVVVVAPAAFDPVFPCGITGNWVPNYLFFHADGTNSYTFAPGETIYSFGADPAGGCKSPSTISPIYATLPSVAKVIAPNAMYAYYVTSSTRTDGGYSYISKTCQKVGPLQYLAGSEQKFSIDTPGDYLITFTNGTTRTLTISPTAVPATSPYTVTMLSAAIPDGTLSLTAVPGSTDLLGDVTGLLNGGTPATQHAYYQWLAGGNVLDQTLALSTNSYVVSSPIWGQTYQVKIRSADENIYSYTSSPPDPCGVPTADGIIISSGFTVPYPSAQVSSATACAGSVLSLSANVPYGTAPFSYTWAAPPGITLADPTASPTTATINPGVSGVQTFTVTIMDSTTPTPQLTTTTVSVTVVSPLTIAALPSLTTTAGQSVTLTASGGPTSYLWSDGSSGGSLTVNPTSTTSYSVTGTFANGCLVTASASVSVTTITTPTGPDLSPILSLPDAQFDKSPGAFKDFVMQIQEVGGVATSTGSVTITVSVPTGYSISFDANLSQIDVSGGSNNPVTVSNSAWQLIKQVDNQQISLSLKAGQFIGANEQSNVGLRLVRTTANSGSVANITVNVSNDPGQGYDIKPANNVYARIISGL
ncbi:MULTISPECIES: hypothetical protein [unclassified Spirosoma]|uniref:hypothetical protein n=1 Tax=unclassified Spirosoma TaxID=2621999 RepID=UPI0009695F5D|nr:MULTISPECIES: hypothetical protein [unclassified Spirosoma]MBN8822288.1 hypothetical protein [Spirosoma sp.]OJW72406.1 MAG: hypothetical protein BGO59_14820 [Spirosoma sp. 48-14]